MAMQNYVVRVNISQWSIFDGQYLYRSVQCLSPVQTAGLCVFQLSHLPLSFHQLGSLRWLDLKNNQLSSQLAAAAGECLKQQRVRAVRAPRRPVHGPRQGALRPGADTAAAAGERWVGGRRGRRETVRYGTAPENSWRHSRVMLKIMDRSFVYPDALLTR